MYIRALTGNSSQQTFIKRGSCVPSTILLFSKEVRTECLFGGCDGISGVTNLTYSSTEKGMAGCMIYPQCPYSWNPKWDELSVSEYTNSWNLRKILWDPGYWVRAATLPAQSQAQSGQGECFEALILLAGLVLHVSGSWAQGDVFDHRLDQNELEPAACV